MTSNGIFAAISFSPLEIPSPILTLSPAHVIWQGKKALNFASHDYLGISQHSDLKKNATKSLLHYGTSPCYAEERRSYVEYEKQLEQKCSQALGVAESHFFSSRWVALSMLLTMLESDSGVLAIDIDCDPLILRVASGWRGKTALFSSEDPSSLSKALRENALANGPKLILVESIGSLSGAACDLNSIYALAKQHGALVLVDDSNSFGVQGIHGLGLCCPNASIDFLLCSLDRGAGSTGALLASNFKMQLLFKTIPFSPREWALPYASLGAIDAAFELIPQLEGERKQLQQRCHWLKTQLKKIGVETSSSSHLFCFRFAKKEEASEMWRNLAEKELLAEQIETGRQHIVRLSINSSHTPEDLGELLRFFEDKQTLHQG